MAEMKSLLILHVRLFTTSQLILGEQGENRETSWRGCIYMIN